MRDYVAYKGITNGAKAFFEAPVAFILLCWIGMAYGYANMDKPDDAQWDKKRCETAAFFQVPTIGFCRINGTEAQKPKIYKLPKGYEP